MDIEQNIHLVSMTMRIMLPLQLGKQEFLETVLFTLQWNLLAGTHTVSISQNTYSILIACISIPHYCIPSAMQ